MAKNRQPIAKHAKALGVSPAAMGYYKKETTRNSNKTQTRRKKSEYATQLQEKQKVKFVYGVLEKQFRGYYEKAVRMPGKAGDNLLMQLETPLPALIYAAKVAHEAGVLVILNPAPFPPEPLPEELLRHVDIIIPNETEAQGMTGIEVTDDASVLAAIRAIQARGVGQVIITVGKRGAATMLDGQLATIPTFPTKAVDTTAAGDTFCGALCVALSRGYKLQEAIRRANKAASISVTRMGAQPSVPTADEVFGQDL